VSQPTRARAEGGVRRVAALRWRAQVQWLYGGSVLVRDGALLVGVVAASSGYLWVTDR
jgi:hypothetical protein